MGRFLDLALGGATRLVDAGISAYISAQDKLVEIEKKRRFGEIEVDQRRRDEFEGKGWELDPAREKMRGDMDLFNSLPGDQRVPDATLDQISRTPVVAAVIGTRVHEFGEFCVPQESPYGTGFVLRLRETRRPPTRVESKYIQEVTKWVTTCGDPRIGKELSFEQWGRKAIQDSLVLDRRTSEIVMTNGGMPAGWYALDAKTIRRAKLTEEERKRGQRNADDGYVQIIDDKVVATFSPEEMMFGIRRPRTSIESNGYGWPELEVLIQTVARIVNAETYNSSNFTSGVHSSGILALKSRMSNKLFRILKNEVFEMLSGAHASKRVPFIKIDPSADEDLKSVLLSKSNQEMEYREWISWLLRVICAVYQMDPAEIGFIYGNEGQKSSLIPAPAGERVAMSKERGLRPLLRGVEAEFNAKIIWKKAPDLEFAFVGYGSQTEAQRIETDGKAVRTFRTLNEIRAEHDLLPLFGPAAILGDMVLDPTFMTAASQLIQAQGAIGSGGAAAGIEPVGDWPTGLEPRDEQARLSSPDGVPVDDADGDGQGDVDTLASGAPARGGSSGDSVDKV